MQESTVTIKGQTTLPRQVREALGLKAGDRIRYLLLDDGEVRILKPRAVSSLSGALHRDGQPAVSLEDMEAAIAQGAGDDR
ncbi:type II toxin-antitoxin system PrlF family antitoxin [Tropicimonas sp. IMCC34043]|uniref:AbrB/MazE/SpoVT family DNA-binding domain-containing protein n=1 Tax=Tropicimonas sp. IMCC34043 TaxID=2248760 RepID=UPI000E220610|nr:type II toxin-antitoxin system PrlF family antitoxin [Tropicimonas sp. IMCC34043]